MRLFKGNKESKDDKESKVKKATIEYVATMKKLGFDRHIMVFVAEDDGPDKGVVSSVQMNFATIPLAVFSLCNENEELTQGVYIGASTAFMKLKDRQAVDELLKELNLN